MATMSACRRSITESRVARSALSRCRTPMAMLRANGMPDTGSESGSATIVSGTAARLTQYPVGGRSVGIVVTDQVHADLQVLEDRVVERSNRQPPIGAVHEIVRRAVVGLG